MATAEEGGATANTTSSSYGGGGAGGKFRKKPFRRQTTPYDRPLTALRGNNINNNSNSSWLAKLVVEPASKLISYGADRLFASFFRRRLPPPPPPQPPEVNVDASNGDQGAGLDLMVQDAGQEPGGVDCRQPINNSSSNVVLELEQLLKQKTFTRTEIVHLTELLQSRAVGVSFEDASHKNVENASDFGWPQEFASGLLEGNRNGEIRSSAVVLTPVHNSKVLEDDISSPAELAKAYMGSRPSKVSPSLLGMRSQLAREDAGLLTNMPFASKSPILSLTKKTSVSLGAPENGFITPRSRSRSAIYSMARTPYSRVHPTSILKGSGINNNGYAGQSTSSSLSPVENNENFESQPVTLKRRSSVLDDEVGSVGPIRRIRQKSNLLGPRFQHPAHGVGIGSHSKQKPGLFSEQRDKALKNLLENESEGVPSTSYARVPSKSSEVAARILQHLEKLSPKEKSSEPKLVAAREKLPLKSTPSVLSGQALGSMDDVRSSSKLLLDVWDDHEFGDKTIATLPDAHDSSPQKQGKTEENDPKASIIPSATWNSVDSVVKNGASQPPHKKRTFRMSAQEDSLEQDDVQCNGLASRSLSEKKGPMVSPLTNSKLAPAEEHKLVKARIESEDKFPSGLISRRTSELSPGAITVGEETIVIAVPTSEETRATSQSEAFASSDAASDKPKEVNNPPSLFSFSSKVADNFPSMPAESVTRAEPEFRSSSSLVNTEVSIGSEVKAPESDKGFHLKLLKPGDINGKCDDVSSSASNGPPVSTFSPVSFPTNSSSASNGPPVSSFSPVSFPTNQISTGSAPLFTSSPSIANFVSTGTTTSATSGDSIFGLAPKPSNPAGPVFKFGSSADPVSAVSAASTTGISEGADQRTKVEINPSCGSSSSSHSTVAAFAAASSGSSTFGLGSSVSFSTANNFQGSLFASASKSLVVGSGSVSQGSSSQLFSSTSAPAFNVKTSTSFGSSPGPTSGFSSLASSSGPSSLAPVGGPTSSLFNFGASPTAVSEGSAPSSTTSASPDIFSFGLSSSSTSTMTVGSSSGAAPSAFNFGGTSSAPASVTNTGSSFSSGTSVILNFGGSSSASSSSSSAPSAVFGSSWQSPKSSIFGSTFTSPSPSTGFAFGAPSTSSASTNARPPMVFNSSTVASSSPVFSFTTSSASALSSPALSNTQPTFGNSPMGGGFAASPGNNDQMNAEDSMAEDPVPSSAPAPIFGQPSVSPSPTGFGFGSTVPSQTNPFIFGGQQNQVAPQNPSPFQATGNQVAPQNPSPFQATGSLEFNAGGSFSLGSGGVDKSGRKIVKINRNKNRRK